MADGDIVEHSKPRKRSYDDVDGSGSIDTVDDGPGYVGKRSKVSSDDSTCSFPTLPFADGKQTEKYSSDIRHSAGSGDCSSAHGHVASSTYAAHDEQTVTYNLRITDGSSEETETRNGDAQYHKQDRTELRVGLGAAVKDGGNDDDRAVSDRKGTARLDLHASVDREKDSGTGQQVVTSNTQEKCTFNDAIPSNIMDKEAPKGDSLDSNATELFEFELDAEEGVEKLRRTSRSSSQSEHSSGRKLLLTSGSTLVEVQDFGINQQEPVVSSTNQLETSAGNKIERVNDTDTSLPKHGTPPREISEDSVGHSGNEIHVTGSTGEHNGTNSGSTQSTSSMAKVASVQRDAEQIAELLGRSDIHTLYERLRLRRLDPNRVAWVTDELLEETAAQAGSKQERVESQKNSASENGSSKSVVDVNEQNVSTKVIPDASGSDQDSKKEETRGEGNDEVRSVVGEISSVLREIKRIQPSLDIDPTKVLSLLEQPTSKEDKASNRLARVVQQLLAEYGEEIGHPEAANSNKAELKCTEEEDIFKQVQEVLLRYPDADANRVFNLLEVFAGDPNVIEKVIEYLRTSSGKEKRRKEEQAPSGNTIASGDTQLRQDPNVKSSTTSNRTTAPAPGGSSSTAAGSSAGSSTKPQPTRKESFKNDPLYKDMKQLAGMFPDRTEIEIYAHLEVYHDRPNRIELVADEFLDGRERPQTSGTNSAGADTVDSSLGSLGKTEIYSGPQPEPPSAASDSVLQKFTQDVELLKGIFPDCETSHIIHQLQDHFAHEKRVDMVTAILMNQKNYPKVKVPSRVEKERERLRRLVLDMEEFLKMFPNPRELFYDETKEMSRVYQRHALLELSSQFKEWKTKYLKMKLGQHNSHFLPTLRDIEGDMMLMGPEMQYYLADEEDEMEHEKEELKWPDEVDEFFYRELLFSKHEGTIVEYIEAQRAARAKRLESAKAAGQLEECGCCFDDEILPEDMTACAEGHLFCRECVARSAEAGLTEGRSRYPCLTGSCPADYPLSLLQALLSSKSFSHVLRLTQEEQLREADIPDLVTCPFCPYATIMPDENDKVLRCLNPECLKESCRHCREPSHLPLRCDEVEKQDETRMRTYIENKMAEAMMRTCPNCRKRFYKIHGCNKMTCVCGQSMCYVCREPINDYEHFNNNQRCNVGHMDQLHAQETEAAAKTAREEYIQEHPEAADMVLKYDPTTGVGTGQQNQGNYTGDDNDNYYDDERDSDDDDDGYY